MLDFYGFRIKFKQCILSLFADIVKQQHAHRRKDKKLNIRKNELIILKARTPSVTLEYKVKLGILLICFFFN